MISAIPTDLLLDTIATRLDPAVIGAKSLTLNLNFVDRDEKARITVENGVMISEMGEAHAKPAVALSGPRQLFLGLFFLKLPLAQLEAAGLKVEGDRASFEALQAAIETPPNIFNIVTP